MTYFVEFAADRIQAYLSRTDPLAARRSASQMLAEAFKCTVVQQVEDWSSATPATAQEADGKLTVCLDSRPSRSAIEAAIASLASKVPGAQITSKVVEAETWEVAKKQLFDTHVAARRLPSILDNPFGRPCDWCGHDVALCEMSVDNDKRRLCRDCSLRSRKRSESRTALERELAEELGAEVPGTLSELARMARPVRGKANHLATIYADGNNLGAIFGGLDPERTATVSQLIEDGVKQALVDATRAIHTAEDAMLPIIPHVRAGDDLLVTVPAPLSLHFVRAFHASLNSNVTNAEAWAANALPGPDGTLRGEVPFTAGVGIVVAHEKHPFKDLVDLCDQMIAVAKKRWSGRENAFAYLDLTTDGPAYPADRFAWPTAWLEALWEDLDDIAHYDSSRRSALGTALTDERLAPAERFLEVAAEASRMGLELPKQFVSTLALEWPQPHPSGIAVSGPGSRAQLLLDALVLTKRWPEVVSLTAPPDAKENEEDRPHV